MKNLTPKSLRFIPAALALVFTLLANHARATITTWDPQGTATQSPYKSSLSQTWENAEWSTATSEGGVATPVNWVEGTSALFAVNSGTGTPAFTVTMNANHTVAGIFDGPDNPNPCPVTLSGTGTIVLPSGTQDFWVSSDTSDPGSLTINNVIAGSGGIQWSADGLGVATLVLNGANTFSGGFYIDQGGNATFGNNAAFGTGAITWSVAGYISSGLPGPYNIGNAMTHLAGIETFGGLSGVATTFSGNWTLPSSGTVTLENIQGTITVSGPISGAAALTINHASTGWSFNGANTFSGALTITAGTLTIGGSGSLTSGGTSGTYSPNIANAGTFTYASSASQTLSGVISGAGTLNQSAGTLILSGANTYTGVTTLSGGILNLNHSETAGTSGPMGNSAASNPGSIVLSGGTLQYSTANNNHDYSGRFSTAANQAYKIDVNSRLVTFATALTSSGGALTLSDTTGGGSLTLTAANTYSGGTTINSGATLNINTGGSLGSGTYAGAIVNNGTFNYNSGGQTFSGLISGSGTLTKSTGTGTLTLSGTANTYSGITTINAGYVYISADASLGAAPGSPVANQLTLNCGTLSAGLRFNANNITLNADRGIYLGTSGGSVNVAQNNTATILGVISGPGNFQSGGNDTTGTGTNVLSGLNTYLGTTAIAAGRLKLGINGALPSGTPLTIGADNSSSGGPGSIFDLGGFSQTIGPLASSTGIGSIPSPAAIPTIVLSGALTVNETSSTLFAGQIVGAGGSLTVNGTATLELSGVNSYSGPTTVANGAVLQLDNNSALGSTASLNLNATPTAGTIFLNFSGAPPAIGALNFGSTSMAQGTWGASGAAHNNPAFTGTGLLNVLTGGTSQTITFPNPGTQTYGVAPITLTATAPGGAVTYTVTSGPASVAGSTLTITGAGSVTVQASQAGNNTYNAATPVSQTFTVLAVSANTVGASPNPALPSQPMTFTATLSALLPPTAGTPTGNVLFKTNGVYVLASDDVTPEPFPLNGSGVATLTLAADALPHGANTVTNEYAGDGNFLGSTNGVVEVVNQLPVSANTTTTTLENQPVTFYTVVLLANASDPDGDPLVITNVESPSANGGSVVLDNPDGIITYTPALNYAGSDSFTYTVSDNWGGTCTPTVTVNVTSTSAGGGSPNVVVPPAYDSETGAFSVTFAGIPGITYTVQTATSPTGPWTFLQTVTAGPDGLFTVTDTELPPPPARYYRTVYIPE